MYQPGHTALRLGIRHLERRIDYRIGAAMPQRTATKAETRPHGADRSLVSQTLSKMGQIDMPLQASYVLFTQYLVGGHFEPSPDLTF
jgi:hypothetical protein